MTTTPLGINEAYSLPFDLTGKTDLAARKQDLGLLIEDLDIGAQLVVPLSTAFYEDRFYLRDANQTARRDLGALRHTAPTVTFGKDTPFAYLVRTGERLPDQRFMPLELAKPAFYACGDDPGTVAPFVGGTKPRSDDPEAAPLHAPLAQGHPGLLVRASEESQHALLHGAFWPGVLVADHFSRVAPRYSTLLADVVLDGDTLTDGRDGREHLLAGLETGLRAVHTWVDDKTPRCGVALWWGNRSRYPGAGRGLAISEGFGGHGLPVQMYAGEGGGGPVGSGAGKTDKHIIDDSPGKLATVQGHLHLDSPWYESRRRDAPPLRDALEALPDTTGGWPWKAPMRYDDELLHPTIGYHARGGITTGRWRWQVPLPFYVPPPPPDPPKLPPQDLPPSEQPRSPFTPIPPPPKLSDPATPPINPEDAGWAQPVPLAPRDGSLFPLSVANSREAASQFVQASVDGASGPLLTDLGTEPGSAALGRPLNPSAAPEMPPTVRELSPLAALLTDTPALDPLPALPGVPASPLPLGALAFLARPDAPSFAVRDTERWAEGLALHVWNDLAFSSLLARPMHSEQADLRFTRDLSLAAAQQLRQAPAGLRLEVLAAEGADGWDLYAHPGTGALHAGGDALSAALWVTPPQLAAESLADSTATTSASLALRRVALDFAITPIRSTGRGGDGFRYTQSAGGSALEFYSLASDGSATRLHYASESVWHFERNNGWLHEWLVAGAGTINEQRTYWSRGTLDTPSAVQASDTALRISAYGYDGSAYDEFAAVQLGVTSIGSGNIAGHIDLITYSSAAAEQTSRLTATGTLELFGATLTFTRTGSLYKLATAATSDRVATFPDATGTVQMLETRTGSGTVNAVGWSYYRIDTSGVACTFNLPAANSVEAGCVIEVFDYNGNAAANNITLTPAGADTVVGASAVIAANYGSAKLRSDGSAAWDRLF